MTRLRLLPASLVLMLLPVLTACEGFRDAMTGHVDVVARAGSAELKVDRLAEMMGPTDVPLQPEAVRTIAQLWVNYQLLGQAAAQDDSLRTPQLADEGMWSTLAQQRMQTLFTNVSKDWVNVDPSTFEERYNKGELLAASHILLAKQPEGISATANDSIKREAEKIARSVTSATFAAVAKARSEDPGSKDKGGDYGVFAPGTMVPEFDAGIRSVAPGGISQVVETQYGYHIIRRHTWAEIKDQFSEEIGKVGNAAAESTYFAGLEKAANVKVKSGAPKLVKAIAEDIDAYRDDNTVLATARSGNLTAARMAKWMGAFPPQSRVRQQVAQAPDSLLDGFVKSIVRNELLLKAADSAEVVVDSAELANVRDAFYNGTLRTMGALEIAPAQLRAAPDGGAERSAREALAAKRVDAYMERLLKNEADFVQVPEPLVIVLRDRFESRVVPAGIDRALAAATKARAGESAGAAEPASAVPLPAPPATKQP
ncbi:MAG: peptidyl-prolyl cis-trans isomerase [Gemmatimonadota bacterium]|nr:peptidyl-prolyl cis-trans isomerase [Gemmatimonadota bacterium]